MASATTVVRGVGEREQHNVPTPNTIICPHCTQATSEAALFCVHCTGFLDLESVLLAETCRTSIADGSAVGADDPVVLLTFECHKNGAESTLVTIAVRAADTSGLRSSLLDRLLMISVRTENGNHNDEDSADG